MKTDLYTQNYNKYNISSVIRLPVWMLQSVVRDDDPLTEQ